MSYQNNNGGGQRPPRKLTILDDFRMRLVGPVAPGGERAATLSMTVKKNRPVIVVKTNIPGDKQFGQIAGEFDVVNFETFLHFLENAAEQIQPGQRAQCKISDFPFQQGGRSKEMKLSSTVFVGREQDGTVYIAVVSWDQSRAVIKFPVRPSQFHSWIGPDGQPFTEASISQIHAKSYARIVGRIISAVLHSEFEAPPPRPQNGGGGGGYGGGGGGGYGGGGGGQGGGYQQNGGGGGGQSNSNADAGLGGSEWPM